MTTLDNHHGADDRSTSNTAAHPVISSNEYEVSNLYESSLALPEDEILQPVMHILPEDNSEGEDFDVSLSDSEKYKLVDDMSEDFTVDPADFQESTDSDDSGDVACVDKKSPSVASSAQKQFTFHEYTQTPSSKNLVVKRMDESSGPVVCRWNNCESKFDSPEELSKHLDFQHDLSDWVCYWTPCSRNLKPFDARYKLIVHLRCHTGEKPYKCTIQGCMRKFSRIENMRLHVRTHTGEKPYACGYEGCPKRFNNSSDRAKHVKTHVQTKPYKCKYPGCDKHYTDPSSMRKHFRSIHFRGEQGKPNKGNLWIHNYSPAPPAKQPRIAPNPVISTNITAVNDTASTDITINSQITSTNSNSNNGNNKLVQVPVFQLPKGEPLSGRSDMSQLIQEGKIQPILLQNGNEQSMLMFVPTANMHDAATGPAAVTMIPVLPQSFQQQPASQNKPPVDSVTDTTSHNSDNSTAAVSTEQPVQPAKNVHVIVSSRKSKEQNHSSTNNT